MREWYYISNNDKQVGPYEETQIISFLANGELSPETLVCTKGMSEWLPAKSLEWFFPQNNQTNKLERLKSSQSFLESHGREKSNFKLHEPLPTAILSFFFTPLLGALMISSNWKKLNKPENASKTMMIFYAYLVVLIASYFAPPLVIFPIIIVLILIGFWFNVHHHSKYLKEHNIHYTSKSVVKPIACGLGIITTSYSITIYSKWDFLKAEFTKVSEAFAEIQQQALQRQQKKFTQDDLSKLKQTLSSDIEKLYSENNNQIKLILVGSVSIILLQALIHIGVNIRLFPTTGMTLPYISYGGSSIISTSILSGIILNLTKRRIDT